MEGAIKGYKLKIKALEIKRESLESEYKMKISENQRERRKLHANLKAEMFAKELLWKRQRLHDAQSLFPPLPASLIFYCCQNWCRLKQWICILRVFAFYARLIKVQKKMCCAKKWTLKLEVCLFDKLLICSINIVPYNLLKLGKMYHG